MSATTELLRDLFFMIIYTKDDEKNLEKFKCHSRALESNKRFQQFNLTKMDILNCLKRFDFRCAYCSQTLNAKYWQLDHFYSKAMGGKNTFENICPTCRWCNTMKNALDGHAFIHKCKMISVNNLIIPMMGLPDNYKSVKYVENDFVKNEWRPKFNKE